MGRGSNISGRFLLLVERAILMVAFLVLERLVRLRLQVEVAAWTMLMAVLPTQLTACLHWFG